MFYSQCLISEVRFVFDSTLKKSIVYESMDSPWCVEENKKALQEMNTSFYQTCSIHLDSMLENAFNF